MATAELAFYNKGYTSTKSSLFKFNYEKKPRMDFEIRKKRKHAKAEEFVKEIKEMYKEAKTVLKKHTDRNRKKAVEYKVGDRVLLSTKDLIWQMRNREIKKLMEKFVEP